MSNKTLIKIKIRTFLSRLIRTTLCLLVMVASPFAVAQQIGTIGVGDLSLGGTIQTQSEEPAQIDALRKKLYNALADTRKFNMISYQQMDEKLAEQGFKIQSFKNPEFKLSESDQIGFDYILEANLAESRVLEKDIKDTTDKVGMVKLNVSLLGVADSTEDFNFSVTSQAAYKVPVGGDVDESALVSNAVDAAVDRMTHVLMSRLLPLRIVIIGEDDVMTLNYGSGLLNEGDVLKVYPEEFEIVSPQLDPIATLVVSQTMQKFSRATVVDGIDELKSGLIALKIFGADTQ